MSMDKIFESEQSEEVHVTYFNPKFNALTRFEFMELLKHEMLEIMEYITEMIWNYDSEVKEIEYSKKHGYNLSKKDVPSIDVYVEDSYKKISLFIHRTQHYCALQENKEFEKYLSCLHEVWNEENPYMANVYDYNQDTLELNTGSIISNNKVDINKLLPKIKSIIYDQTDTFEFKDDAIMHRLNRFMKEFSFIELTTIMEYIKDDRDDKPSTRHHNIEELLTRWLYGSQQYFNPVHSYNDGFSINSFYGSNMFKCMCSKDKHSESVHRLSNMLGIMIYNMFCDVIEKYNIRDDLPRIDVPDEDIMQPLFNGDEQLIKLCKTKDNVQFYMYDAMFDIIEEMMKDVILTHKDWFFRELRPDVYYKFKKVYVKMFNEDKWKTLLE